MVRYNVRVKVWIVFYVINFFRFFIFYEVKIDKFCNCFSFVKCFNLYFYFWMVENVIIDLYRRRWVYMESLEIIFNNDGIGSKFFFFYKFMDYVRIVFFKYCFVWGYIFFKFFCIIGNMSEI